MKSNGLELESVSLTKLDQTDVKFFNPENFFDAEGLTQLKTVTETRRRDRNSIVRDNEVAIAQKDLEARQQTLTIERTKKEAELSQERDIANKTASTRAEVATATQTARLTEENARIDTDRAVAEKEAGAKQVKETAVIESDLAINKRKTDAQREIQIATQENEIQIAAKSKQTSEAVAEAKTAEALAVSAEEKVVTARAVEVADRARLTQVLAARTEAERKSTELIVAAEAEKKASLDRAEAVKTLATAEAESNKIKAVGVRNIGEAEAAVITLKNEAQNKLGANVIDFELAKKRIETMPSALAEMVKPIAQPQGRPHPAHRRRVRRQWRRRRQCRLRRRACRRAPQGARAASDDRRDPAPERVCAGRRSREGAGRRGDRKEQRCRGAGARAGENKPRRSMNAGSLLRRIRIDMNCALRVSRRATSRSADRSRLEPFDCASDESFKATPLVAAAPAPIDVRHRSPFRSGEFHMKYFLSGLIAIGLCDRRCAVVRG